jgi:Lon protease-like protein
MNSVPLFPLNTVLFPEGLLPLRIFETRYLDMISESLRNQSAFGVCLIAKGSEVGEPAECHEIGTFAHIIDWSKGSDGLLGITVQGGKRFRVLNTRVRKNNLMEGDVEIIDDNDKEELPVEYQVLSDLLRQIADKFRLVYLSDHTKYLDANWVGCRLAELLPFDLDEKQMLLELDDPVQRLERIQTMLHGFTVEQLNN